MRSRATRLYERLAGHRALRALPLLLALAAAITALALVVHTAALDRLDQAATHAMQSARSPLLDRWAIAWTFLGNTLTLVCIAFASAIAMAIYGHFIEAGLTLLSLLAVPLNPLLKLLINRPRPSAKVVTIILPAFGWSFPSGHSMVAATLYGWLAYTAWILVADRARRAFSVAAFTFIAIMVGISRVYLGVHWFSDVLGGWAAGAFCLIVLALIYRPVALARHARITSGRQFSANGE